MKANDAEIARLFLQAEQSGMCLVAPSRRIGDILRRKIQRGEVVKPARGMYARELHWRSLSKSRRMLHVMRTMQSLHPNLAFCHESAAVAFGLPVSNERLGEIHVAMSRSQRNASSKGIRWHVVEHDELAVAQGLRVTSLPRTAFDCMRTSDFKQALPIADGALRASGRRSNSLVSCFRRIGGNLAGTARAVRTMRYADARAESGGESIARAAMIRQGFALPELQVSLPQPLDPRRSFRVDFLWNRLDGGRVIGEFDGMRKYEDEAMLAGRSSLRALADEQHREAQLTLYGMPIVRFSYKDVMDERRLAALLERYKVPRSADAARFERRLERSRSASAQIFTVCSLLEESLSA